MKRIFVLGLLAFLGVAATADTASAWNGYWRYRLLGCLPGHGWSRSVNVHVSRPYNAFTPFCGGFSYGVGNCCSSPCETAGCGMQACGMGGMGMMGPVCGMMPMAPSGDMTAFASPYYLPAAPTAAMPMQGMPMQAMPMHQANPYGVQPAGYSPMGYGMPTYAPAWGYNPYLYNPYAGYGY